MKRRGSVQVPQLRGAFGSLVKDSPLNKPSSILRPPSIERPKRKSQERLSPGLIDNKNTSLIYKKLDSPI